MTEKLNLKDLRKKFILTQRQLADMVSIKVPITRKAVSMWETGERVPSRLAMMRLCEIFGMTYAEIAAMFIGGENGTVAS